MDQEAIPFLHYTCKLGARAAPQPPRQVFLTREEGTDRRKKEKAVYSRKVGARRTAELCFLTPPSEPGMRLSPHPALQGVAFPAVAFVAGSLFLYSFQPPMPTLSRQKDILLVIGSLSSQQPVLLTTPGLHREICDCFVPRTSLPWPPSPCTRLSRAPSTMEPPTLA